MQALREFKQNHHISLIEDNAHGLYSKDSCGNSLGSLGDIAIFSFTKSLPTTDGGALVVNNVCGIEPRTNGDIPDFFPIIKKFIGKASYQLIRKVRKKKPKTRFPAKRTIS